MKQIESFGVAVISMFALLGFYTFIRVVILEQPENCGAPQHEVEQ